MTRDSRVRARNLVFGLAVLQLHLGSGFGSWPIHPLRRVRRTVDVNRGAAVCGARRDFDAGNVLSHARTSRSAAMSRSAAAILRSRVTVIRPLPSTGRCRRCARRRPPCSPTFAATTAAPASPRRSRFRIPISPSLSPVRYPTEGNYYYGPRSGPRDCRGARTRSTGSIRTEERGLA